MSTTVLKFKAGLVSFNAETKSCVPRPLKGEVEVTKTNDEDMVFHNLVWTPKENIANADVSDYAIDELMLIPGDVSWAHVKSCKTGRVFALCFSSGEKVFFWMQEKNDNEDDLAELSRKDKEICEKINSLITEKDEEEEEEDDDEEAKQKKTTEAKQKAAQEDSEDVEMTGTSTESNNEISLPSADTKKQIISIEDVFSNTMVTEYVDKNLSDEKLDDLLQIYLSDYSEEYKYSSIEDKKQLLKKVLASAYFKSSERKLSILLNQGATGSISEIFQLEYRGEGVENFIDAVRKKATQ